MDFSPNAESKAFARSRFDLYPSICWTFASLANVPSIAFDLVQLGLVPRLLNLLELRVKKGRRSGKGPSSRGSTPSTSRGGSGIAGVPVMSPAERTSSATVEDFEDEDEATILGDEDDGAESAEDDGDDFDEAILEPLAERRRKGIEQCRHEAGRALYRIAENFPWASLGWACELEHERSPHAVEENARQRFLIKRILQSGSPLTEAELSDAVDTCFSPPSSVHCGASDLPSWPDTASSSLSESGAATGWTWDSNAAMHEVQSLSCLSSSASTAHSGRSLAAVSVSNPSVKQFLRASGHLSASSSAAANCGSVVAAAPVTLDPNFKPAPSMFSRHFTCPHLVNSILNSGGRFNAVQSAPALTGAMDESFVAENTGRSTWPCARVPMLAGLGTLLDARVWTLPKTAHTCSLHAVIPQELHSHTGVDSSSGIDGSPTLPASVYPFSVLGTDPFKVLRHNYDRDRLGFFAGSATAANTAAAAATLQSNSSCKPPSLDDIYGTPCAACLPCPVLLHLRTIMYVAAGRRVRESRLRAIGRPEEFNQVARFLIMCGAILVPMRHTSASTPVAASSAAAASAEASVSDAATVAAVESTVPVFGGMSLSDSAELQPLSSPPVVRLVRAMSVFAPTGVMRSAIAARERSASALFLGLPHLPQVPRYSSYKQLRALYEVVQIQLCDEWHAALSALAAAENVPITDDVLGLVAAYLH
jgi:hypothetical protein